MGKVQLDINLNPQLDVAKMNVLLNNLKQSLGKLGSNINLIDANKLNKELGQLDDAVRRIDDQVTNTNKKLPIVDPINDNSFFKFNMMAEALERFTGAIGQVTQPAIQFEKSLSAVGAITGMTGNGLTELGDKARELAVQFGTNATDQLASFQGVLSRLGPQVAEDAASLQIISANINTLAKAGGIDAATSMDALTTALLQLDLASGTTAETAKNSTDAINSIAAGAQVGAAEIPQVAEAMRQAGQAAKGANIDLVGLNAGIQTLAIGGKTGSEAGIALRNIIGYLQKASGPAADALKQMGISSAELGETLTTQGLDAAMAKVATGLNTLGSDAEKNAALITIFGQENAAAASTLVSNLDKFQEFSDGIKAGMQGTGSAFEQANINMDNTAFSIEKMDAQFNDMLITIGSKLPASLTTLAGFGTSIAPLATTFVAMQGTIAPLAKDMLLKLVPSLFTTTTSINAAGVATTAASFSFQKFWTAVTGPVGIAVAGIAALVGAVALLSDIFTETAEEKLADAKAEGELLNAQMKTNEERQKTIQNNQELISSYKQLATDSSRTAEENAKMADIQSQLSKTFPGAIKDVNDYAGNLQRLAVEATNSEKELRKLKDEQAKLKQDAAKNEIVVGKAQIDVDTKNIKDATFLALGPEVTKLNDDLVKMNQKIKDATTDSEVENAVTEFRGKLQTMFPDFYADSSNAEDILNIEKALKPALENGKKLIDTYGPAFQKSLQGALSGNKKIDFTQLSKDFNIPIEEAKQKARELAVEMINGGANSTEIYKKLADSTGQSVEGIKAAVEAEKERQTNLLYSEAITAKDAKTYNEKVGKLKELLSKEKEDLAVLEMKKMFSGGLTKDEQQKYDILKKNVTAHEKNISQLSTIEKIVKGEKATRKEVNEAIKQYEADLQKVLQTQTLLDMLTGAKDNEKQAIIDKINALKNYNFEKEKEADDDKKKSDAAVREKESQYKINAKNYDQIQSIKKEEQAITDIQTAKILKKKEGLITDQAELNFAKEKLERAKEDKALFEEMAGVIASADGKSFATMVNISDEDFNDAQKRLLQFIKEIEQAESNVIDLEIKIKDKDIAETAEKWQKEQDELFAKSTEAKKKAAEELERSLKESSERIIAQQEKELSKLEQIRDAYLRIFDAAAKSYETSYSDAANAEKEKEIVALDKKFGKLKEVSDEERKYNEERAEIERTANNKIMMIQEIARAQRLEAERQMTLVILEEQLKRTQAELDSAVEAGDQARVDAALDNYNKLSDQIGEKKDLLLQYSSEISTGLTDAFSNIFSDEEKMKEPWKKLFAITAGALKNYASMVVAKLILGDLSKAGGSFAAIVLLPIVTGLANALISKILDPILSSVASFATGGVITQPTLSVIGDAKKAGSRSNAEMVLNTEVFGAVLDEVLARYTSAMDRYFAQPLSQGENGQVRELSAVIGQLNQSINAIKPYFDEGQFTPENIMSVIENFAEQKKLAILFDQNQITMQDYAGQLNTLQLHVRSYASGSSALYNPELALIGDAGPNNPERVLNDPQLREIIAESADRAASRIEDKLDEHAQLLIAALNSFNGRLNILESDIGLSANRFNNRQTINVRRTL